MKKIVIILILLFIYGANAQPVTIFSEGFEFGDVPPSGWASVDGDGDGKKWNIGSSSANSHSGNFFARSHSADNSGPLNPNNWLITPSIQLQPGVNLLKFWIGGSGANFRERVKIVLSEAGQPDTTMFTKTLYRATLQTSEWNQITVNLTAFANKNIRLAFVHYNCTDQFYLKLDDVSVTYEPDTVPPEVVDNTNPVFPANQNAEISMKITDFSAIQSATVYYKINGGATLNMAMTAIGSDYSANLPGQADASNATYQVVVKDAANNTTTTSQKIVSWSNTLWFNWGNVYDNFGLGYLASPWKAAADFDFGSTVYKIRKIESAMLYPESGCSWNITGFDSLPMNNYIGDLTGSINFTGNYNADIIDINSNTTVTSKFAVVIRTNGNKMQMDQQGPDNHSFIASQDSTFRLVTKLPGAENYHGSWHIRVFAEIDGTGIEESEFVPGEIRLANYPNPFNPTTTIKFFNNCTGNVNLTVYNYKGEIVKELVNSRLNAGEHNYSFDGSRLSSGVYFYKLTTPVKSLTGRMLMIK